jgi:predicted nucleic acid-binding protein
MFYLNTSVTVALFTNGPEAEAAHAFIERLLGLDLAGVCSDWSLGEYRCAIAAKHRSGLITLKNIAAVANALGVLREDKFVGASTLPTDVLCRLTSFERANSPHKSLVNHYGQPMLYTSPLLRD